MRFVYNQGLIYISKEHRIDICDDGFFATYNLTYLTKSTKWYFTLSQKYHAHNVRFENKHKLIMIITTWVLL